MGHFGLFAHTGSNHSFTLFLNFKSAFFTVVPVRGKEFVCGYSYKRGFSFRYFYYIDSPLLVAIATI
ncbi:hypothetical protein GGTG_05052 [Gaeumannomyces tritici R3-111a-1]|uniref:Uncharacterized protein n=1 Tax=Gaeumannomyces tritici (strain R3-111a-1) TaxID=644352 RepID=J3NUU6_GAET3|nr:hypothetical protein GGTG_05052 [Gaeumannomyces tritici R3-111a-1]EJT79970.1 hypothetical protein GGTG_05052 [Gaeumannomyces tritici R3-111a-1]